MTAGSFIQLFHGLRWSLMRNHLQVARERSLLRVITILLCSMVVWGSLFGLSFHGFREMVDQFNLPLNGLLLGFLFDVMFMALMILLTFSTGIILFSSLFSSGESSYLLSTPIPADHIFAYKMQGATAFSSWAFVLLGSPVLIAYGLTVTQNLQGGNFLQGAPWYFYALLPLYFLGFILIPGTLGAMLCLVVVNVLPRQRKQVALIVAMGLLLVAAALGWHWYGLIGTIPFGSRDWFTTILGEFSPVSSIWVPSHWIARGLQAAALGDLVKAEYYLALIWSNGLFLYVIVTGVAKFLYRRGYNRMASGGTLRKKYGGLWLDDILNNLLFFFDPQTRLLIVKDFRTFRRDPAQWFQILIFLFLTVFYFYNMRQFYEQGIGRSFRIWISLLTLTAIGLLMCAYTGRFIYPLLSLEGRKFWILGLLPLNRDRLLWGKFAFSTCAILIVAELLVVFSNLMLAMPMILILIHTLTVAVLACTMSGLSVGLGACMPNFRENDPSKIAVGMGGTLNLIACLLVLLAVILLMTFPAHFMLYMVEKNDGRSSWMEISDRQKNIFLIAGLGIGFLATYLPLRAGAKNLREMEF